LSSPIEPKKKGNNQYQLVNTVKLRFQRLYNIYDFILMLRMKKTFKISLFLKNLL